MRSEQDRVDQRDREVLAHEMLGDSFEVLGETLNLLVEKTLESQPAENLPIRLPEALRAENIFGTLFGRTQLGDKKHRQQFLKDVGSKGCELLINL